MKKITSLFTEIFNVLGGVFASLVLFVGIPALIGLFMVNNNLVTEDMVEPDPHEKIKQEAYEEYLEDKQPQSFGSYECTDDCSGHEAGYEWAYNKDIEDMDDCGGNSDSFIEGCLQYVEELEAAYEDSDYDYDYYAY